MFLAQAQLRLIIVHCLGHAVLGFYVTGVYISPPAVRRTCDIQTKAGCLVADDQRKQAGRRPGEMGRLVRGMLPVGDPFPQHTSFTPHASPLSHPNTERLNSTFTEIWVILTEH